MLLLLTLSWLLSSLPLMLLMALLARPRILGASINRGLRGERVLARDRISTSAAPRVLSLSVSFPLCPPSTRFTRGSSGECSRTPVRSRTGNGAAPRFPRIERIYVSFFPPAARCRDGITRLDIRSLSLSRYRRYHGTPSSDKRAAPRSFSSPLSRFALLFTRRHGGRGCCGDVLALTRISHRTDSRELASPAIKFLGDDGPAILPLALDET